MRYLHVRLASDEALLHPLVPTLTDPEVFRAAQMVDWAPSFDPPRATVLLYLDGDLDHFETVLQETDIVLESDVTRFGDGRGYAYVHSEPHPIEWELFAAGAMEGLIPVFPIEYNHDGSLEARLVGPPARLQDAMAALPEAVDATIERVGEYDLGRPPIPPSLPPRQQAALDVALDLGYYDVPRRATRDEVAERLGCAPSTASEHLQKAEGAIVRTYLNRQG
ncbi:helix-turn-helix domain-containing protein [Haloarchaeobius amylolyticus]|uniref:helix-turn-helix domain-containing protein n=1 Tax=Haloarchaeobius amylolyticus TaxID=1198296 RepID=UPI00227181F6|nr:helix-turn-helix domain-containing protein [Haloarchaeobius amylolyticus]